VTNVVGQRSLKDLSSHTWLSEEDVLPIASQAVNILKAIHSRGYLYLDLKPEHFVFQGDKLYLIDYGSTIKMDSNVSSYRITPKYSSTDYFIGLTPVLYYKFGI
jgi:serine/threonine protein kinase